jgi:hypothetical protein
VADSVPPIQPASDQNNLYFISQEGSAASLTPVEHKISFNSATNQLTDTTYAVNAGTQAPNWTFSATPTATTILLTNVAASGTTSVFQYFAFAQPKNAAGAVYKDGAGNPYMILLDGNNFVPGTTTMPANSPSPLTTPLSATDAGNAVEVVITFYVKPSGGTGENTNVEQDTVTDSVVLRVTAAANHAGAGTDFEPCS